MSLPRVSALGGLLLLGVSCRSAEPPAEVLALDRDAREQAAQVQWGRGIEQRSRGDFAAAVDSFLEAARLDPEAAMPRREVGRMLLSVGHDETAHPFLESSRRPDDPRGLLELAFCRRRLGDHDGAIEVLSELNGLRPQDKLPLIQLHALLLLEGRAPDGKELFTRVVDQELPLWPFAHEALGDFQLRTEDLPGALHSYRQASKLGGLSESLERKTALAERRISARVAPPRPDPAPGPGLGVSAPAPAPGEAGAAVRGGGP